MSRSACLAGVAAVFLAATAQAQDHTARVDSIFSFATAGAPGCAAGVSQHGRVLVNKGYGLANVESRLPLTTWSARCR
jgi:CubicO group peptidase (beta-lactamase class C family)